MSDLIIINEGISAIARQIEVVLWIKLHFLFLEIVPIYPQVILIWLLYGTCLRNVQIVLERH